MSGDTCPHRKAIKLLVLKIKEVIKPVTGKCFLGPDNEFMIDMAFSLTNPINLTHGKSHGTCQLGQIAVVPIAQLEDSGSDYHGRVF